MTDKNKYSKDTDRDVKPTRGQESNENWDDTGENEPDTKASNTGGNIRETNEETNTTGYGSAEKAARENIGGVGPLDADFDELPSQKYSDSHDRSGNSGI